MSKVPQLGRANELPPEERLKHWLKDSCETILREMIMINELDGSPL